MSWGFLPTQDGKFKIREFVINHKTRRYHLKYLDILEIQVMCQI